MKQQQQQQQQPQQPPRLCKNWQGHSELGSDRPKRRWGTAQLQAEQKQNKKQKIVCNIEHRH
jgi:hypothetical protein